MLLKKIDGQHFVGWRNRHDVFIVELGPFATQQEAIDAERAFDDAPYTGKALAPPPPCPVG